MLREAYDFPTASDDMPSIGHDAIPIMSFRDDLSHGGHRFQRRLIAKAKRARLAPSPLSPLTRSSRKRVLYRTRAWPQAGPGSAHRRHGSSTQKESGILFAAWPGECRRDAYSRRLSDAARAAIAHEPYK
jgi:hypothetical protein